MDFVLKAKAWQVFIIVVLIPFSIHYYGIHGLFGGNNISPTLITIASKTLTVLVFSIFLTWLRTLGLRLNAKIPKELRPSNKPFKIAIIYIAIYTIIFQLKLLYLGAAVSMKVLFPFHIAATFLIFYCLLFIAKNLTTIEKQANLNSVTGSAFFQLWFFPIGIWFLQPRVNKVFSDS